MKCEKCKNKHDGSYASGRFCSKECARSFSTRKSRKEINKKVSKALKGRPASGKPFIKGYDSRRENKQNFCKERRKVICRKSADTRLEQQTKLSWEVCSLPEKRRRVLVEQENKCLCGINTWNGMLLVLELHHVDGDNANDTRKNIQLLCPNCHSQTETWRGRNIGQ